MVPGGALTGSANRRRARHGGQRPHPGGGRVVLLAGPGDSTDIVANYLASRVSDLVVVVEDPPVAPADGPATGATSGMALCRRPGPLRRSAPARTPTSVGAPAGRHPGGSLGRRDAPSSLVTGCRRSTTRRPSRCSPPFGRPWSSYRGLGSSPPGSWSRSAVRSINMHAGITPRYRGVHGGYWALAEQHPEWVGTTVHLVDPGIDTGGILAQATFEVTGEDTIATYPDLHLVHGLPLLGAQVDKVMAGRPLEPRTDEHRPRLGPLLPPDALGLPVGVVGATGSAERAVDRRTRSLRPPTIIAPAERPLPSVLPERPCGRPAPTLGIGGSHEEEHGEELEDVTMPDRPGALVISLDFELHWGVTGPRDAGRCPVPAPEPGPPGGGGHGLACSRHRHIRATWATVGFLFASNRGELEAHLPRERPTYAAPRARSLRRDDRARRGA